MVIRISDFRKPIIASAQPLPTWVETPTQIALFNAMIKSYDEIQSALSGDLTQAIRDRQISARQVARLCNVSPSTLTVRRQPKLVALLGELNTNLGELFKSLNSKKGTSGRKLTKQELIKENHRLKNENETLRNLALTEGVLCWINHSLPNVTRQNAITIAKLKEEIMHKDEVISNQAEQNRKFIESL